MLEHALAYLERGWCVIPATEVADGVCSCGRATCDSAGKHPRIAWTPYQTKQSTQEEVRRWWRRWPAANIAIVTGAVSGIVVLDIDPRHGGDESLLSLGALPPTLTSLTGGGGQHLIYAHPGAPIANGANLLPGIDLRGDGGYIIVPPSSHSSGRQYAWEVETEDLPPAPLPEAVTGILGGYRRGLAAGVETSRFNIEEILAHGVAEGQRNDQMARLAGHFIREGQDALRALESCLGANRLLFQPPLPEAEVRATVTSIWRREQRKVEVAGAAAAALAGQVDSEQLTLDERQTLATSIWGELGVEGVTSWRLFLSEPPVYLLETGRGEVNLGDNLLSLAAVRERIFTQLGVLVPKHKAAEWEARAIALRGLVELAEVEGPSGERISDWVEAYLDEYPPREWEMNERRAAFSGGPISVEGVSWLRPAQLRNYVEAVFGDKLTLPQMRRLLKQAGWEPGILETTSGPQRRQQRGWRKALP